MKLGLKEANPLPDVLRLSKERCRPGPPVVVDQVLLDIDETQAVTRSVYWHWVPLTR